MGPGRDGFKGGGDGGASHGRKRVHLDSLTALARLLAFYAQSPALFSRDAEALGPPGDLPASEDAAGG
jgi:hypothetical protein